MYWSKNNWRLPALSRSVPMSLSRASKGARASKYSRPSMSPGCKSRRRRLAIFASLRSRQSPGTHEGIAQISCQCRAQILCRTLLPVLDMGCVIRRLEEPGVVGLVLGEEQHRVSVAAKLTIAQRCVGGGEDACSLGGGRFPEHGPGRSLGPAPCVSEPERRQDPDRGRLGAAVAHRDPDQDVLRCGLSVLDEDVEVPVAGEHAGIEKLVLLLQPAALLVSGTQVVVREGSLGVLVQIPHVRMGRRAVEIEVVLLDVLPMVALAVGEAEESFLEDRVLAVPERDGEAQQLLVIRQPGNPVLTPVIGS